VSFDKPFEHSEELLNAALAEFSDKGYEQASINTILTAAGMSKGQFYYHFGGKEKLYFALVEILIARKRAFLASVMGPEEFQQDIFTILQTQIRYGLRFAQEYPLINRFAERFAKEQGNPIYRKVLQTYNFADDAPINNLIEQAHRNGDFRADLPLPFIQKTVTFLLTHAVELADLRDSKNVEEQLDYLVIFLKHGLAK